MSLLNAAPAAVVASIPSPSQGVWQLGPFPLRAYALCILLGIFVAIWVTDRRWVARGGQQGLTYDVAMWAVPFGIIGGRLYHVLTDWDTYFGPGGSGLSGAVAIWRGGLGIWGAVALGALGAWIGCRRAGVPLPPWADALAVGLPLAQAIGRFGNWFNQELFGRPTDLPWGLAIDPANRPAGYEQFATFHPTFLYEALWLVLVALVVAWADRRGRMGHGRAFALYVALYCLGRLGIETIRIDPATLVGGLRINVLTASLVGLGGLVYLVVSARQRPGREDPALLQPRGRGDAGPLEDGSVPGSERGSDRAEQGSERGSEPGSDGTDPADTGSGKA
ncbi:MAG TPA: prolipoprotein diacylglyceryl transferase [Candidatus Nanopelagicales bacterium]